MDTSPEDFRIKDLRKDKDALVLIGVSLAIGLLVVIGLAFLPDTAWDRLVERSKLLWVAGIALVPTLMAISNRYRLRRGAVDALGQAAFSPTIVAPEDEA